MEAVASAVRFDYITPRRDKAAGYLTTPVMLLQRLDKLFNHSGYWDFQRHQAVSRVSCIRRPVSAAPRPARPCFRLLHHFVFFHISMRSPKDPQPHSLGRVWVCGKIGILQICKMHNDTYISPLKVVTFKC